MQVRGACFLNIVDFSLTVKSIHEHGQYLLYTSMGEFSLRYSVCTPSLCPLCSILSPEASEEKIIAIPRVNPLNRASM